MTVLSSGPLYPSYASAVAEGVWTVGFSGTANIYASDNVYQTVTLGVGGYSKRVRANQFGFAIPASATITGIKVEMEHDWTAGAGNPAYDLMQLSWGGSRRGAKRPGTLLIPAGEQFTAYGGASDLWGALPTPANVNATDFGVDYAVIASSAGTHVSIDSVRVTVYYDYTLGGPSLPPWALSREPWAMGTPYTVTDDTVNGKVTAENTNCKAVWHYKRLVAEDNNRSGGALYEFYDKTIDPACANNIVQLITTGTSGSSPSHAGVGGLGTSKACVSIDDTSHSAAISENGSKGTLSSYSVTGTNPVIFTAVFVVKDAVAGRGWNHYTITKVWTLSTAGRCTCAETRVWGGHAAETVDGHVHNWGSLNASETTLYLYPGEGDGLGNPSDHTYHWAALLEHDGEIVWLIGASGNVNGLNGRTDDDAYTILRGYGGTTPKTHANNSEWTVVGEYANDLAMNFAVSRDYGYNVASWWAHNWDSECPGNGGDGWADADNAWTEQELLSLVTHEDYGAKHVQRFRIQDDTQMRALEIALNPGANGYCGGGLFDVGYDLWRAVGKTDAEALAEITAEFSDYIDTAYGHEFRWGSWYGTNGAVTRFIPIPYGTTWTDTYELTLYGSMPPLAGTVGTLFDGTLKFYIGGTNSGGVNTGGLDVTAAVQPGAHWGNTNPGGFGDAGLRLGADILPPTLGAVLELHAASANAGHGPGVNSPLTTTFDDTSGYVNDGTLNNFAGKSPWIGAGTADDPYRLVFDGTSDYVSLPDLSAAEDKTFAYEAWFMTTSAGLGLFVGEAGPSADVPYTCLGINAGKLWGRQRVDGGTIVTKAGSGTVNDGAVHHAVMSCDGVNGQLYLDGSADGAPFALMAGTPALNTTTVGGVFVGYAQLLFPGGIALVRVCPFALSPTQVAQNYTAGCTYAKATRPFGAYDPLVVKGAPVLVTHGTGGGLVELYEGEVTNDVSHATIQGGQAFYDVTCAGLWWKAGQRKDYVEGWTDDDISQFYVSPKASRQFDCSIEGSIRVEIPKGNAYEAGKAGSILYYLHGGLGDPDEYIHHIESLGNVDVDAASWYCEWSTGADPWSGWDSPPARRFNNETVPPAWSSAFNSVRIPTTGSMPTTTKAVRMCLYNTADGTAANKRWGDFKKIRVYIGDSTKRHETGIATVGNSVAGQAPITTAAAHNLTTGDSVFISGVADSNPQVRGYYTATVTGSDTFTVPATVTTPGTGGLVCGGLRVEEVMAQVATHTGLAASASVSPLAIAAPNGMTNWMARPYTTAAQFLEECAMKAGLPFNWGFWDDPATPNAGLFTASDRVAPIGAAANRYLIDANTPCYDYDVFADTEYAFDYVRLLYGFKDVDGGSDPMPDGTIKECYAPSDPGWSDMTKRVLTYDFSDVALTDDAAAIVCAQILAYIASTVNRGSISCADLTVPLYGGGTKMLGYVRSGDWVEESHADTGLLCIAAYSFEIDGGTGGLTIGEDREFTRHPVPAPTGNGPRRPVVHPPIRGRK